MGVEDRVALRIGGLAVSLYQAHKPAVDVPEQVLQAAPAGLVD